MRNKFILLILFSLHLSVFAECIKNIPVSYKTGNGWSQNEIAQVSFLTELEIRNKYPYYSSNGTPSFYATIYLSSGTRIIKIASHEVVDAIFNCETFNFLNDSYLYGIDNKDYSWRFDVAQIASSRNSSSNGYNQPNSSNSGYQSPIDLNQHEATMAAVQAQRDRERDYFNSLSTKDRASLNEYQDYQQQKNWVGRQVINKTNHFFRYNDKLKKSMKKESKKIIAKYGFRRQLKIDDLENGWHEIITFVKWGDNSFQSKRFIQVYNKEITAYIGGTNLIFYEPTYYEDQGMYKLKIPAFGENQTDVSFYVTEGSLLSKPPKYQTPIMLILSTTSYDHPKVFIFNKTEKYFFDGLNRFNGRASDKNCNTTSNVIRIPLPPGEYEYVVATDTKYWNDKFKLDYSKSCRILTFTD